jgi:Rieske Fe-S protein
VQRLHYIVARDQAGLFAHSNVCTHEGCEVPTPDTNGVSVCPCHLARFDAQGNNVLGPNGRGTLPNLPHYRVKVQGAGDSARIVVDTSTVESNRAARTPVPEGQPASDAGMADGATV